MLQALLMGGGPNTSQTLLHTQEIENDAVLRYFKVILCSKGNSPLCELRLVVFHGKNLSPHVKLWSARNNT